MTFKIDDLSNFMQFIDVVPKRPFWNKIVIQQTLDLHGFTQAQAYQEHINL